MISETRQSISDKTPAITKWKYDY